MARWARLALLAWAFLPSAGLLAAEESPAARVGRASGVLAVQSEATPAWRLLSQSDALPAECSLRTASAGPCLIELPGYSLHLDADTELRLNVPNRRIAVESGRIFLRTAIEAGPWTIAAGDLELLSIGGSAVEVKTAAAGKPTTVAVTQGTATAARGPDAPATIASGNRAAWNAEKRSLQVAAMSAEEQQRTELWTAAPKPTQGLGQLVIKDAQAGSPTRLDVARYHVNVVLQPPVALVQIDQTFYNPSYRQEEGTFVFNLPRGASVSRFAMYVTRDQLIEGELIERQRAANIYQTIVNQRRDPAILEQIGENLFKMRVFPIFARDTKRILLDFTLPLEEDHGQCRFRLPLFSDLRPIWDFRLSGTIRGAAKLDSLASLSHPDLAFRRTDDGAATFTYEQKNHRPQTDFALSFAQKLDEAATLRSYVAEPLPPRRDLRDKPAPAVPPAKEPAAKETPAPHEKYTYFLATLPPERGKSGTAEPPPADVLVLADTSSSMRGSRAVRRAVRMIAGNLRAQDRFRLMCVDVSARPLHDGWCKPGGKESQAALNRLDQEFCLGGTDFAASLREAAKSFVAEDAGRRRLVIYVGDGEESMLGGEEMELSTRTPLQEAGAPLIGVVVRRGEQGLWLLDYLARETGGLVFDLTGGQDRSRGLFGWLLAGLPTPERIVKCEVEGAEKGDLYYPTAWLPGKPLQIHGRTKATDHVRLKLTVGLGKHTEIMEHTLPIQSKDDDVFVGRLWGQLRLDDFRHFQAWMVALNRDRNIAPTPEQIVELSQEWSLLSPHTAFLVLESEEDYKRWNVDRQQRRRYWKPADALVKTPLPADWIAQATVPAKPQAVAASRPAPKPAPVKQLLEALGPHRGLFDPAARIDRFCVEPGLPPASRQPSAASPEFLRKHPCAEKLLQTVDVTPKEVRVDMLVNMLAEMTGANVMLDFKALSDVGIATDAKLHVDGFGKMSLRNYAKTLLRQGDLVLLEEPHRLLITTPEVADRQLTTEVYPLADLLYTDRVADRAALSDPYFDRETAARERLRTKLRRPISVDFHETPLDEVVKHIAGQLNDTVLLDRRALDNVGIATDTRVTASWRNVPAGEGLRWLIRPLDLSYSINRETLTISTPEVVDQQLTTRVVSGRGVVFELSAAAREQMAAGMGGFGSDRMALGMMGGGFGGMGMGGSMGGGSLGGMGGGFAGGMGGMAGGTFGGPAGPTATGGPSPSDDNLSSGGDADGRMDNLSDDEQAADNPPDSRSATNLSVAVSQSQRVARSGGQRPFVISVIPVADPGFAGLSGGSAVAADFSSGLDLITSTIRPASWDAAGGPGSVQYFWPTMDFVFAQTDEVHEEIESLLDRLRRLPVAQRDMKPAEPEATDAPGDLEQLRDTITSAIRPSTWDASGGPGNISRDDPHLALVASQTEEGHEEVSRLLTLLRRSRYATVRGQRPWESAALPADGPWFGTLGSGVSAEIRESSLPPPKAEQLELLKVRRVPKDGQWKWQRENLGADTKETLTIRRSGGTLEIETPHCTIRTRGDAAAIAWPGLGVVEHGNWGQAIRRQLDAWLPWMPHRSNEELAQWFEVSRVEPQDAEQNADFVRLRLIPRGFSPESGTHIDATFNRNGWLLESWRMFVEGKLTGRLQHDGIFGGDDEVSLYDTEGHRSMRWERLNVRQKRSLSATPTSDWEGYVHLDRRGERPLLDKAFHEGLTAMQRGEWAAAYRALQTSAQEHPGHPLLLLLRAECCQHEPELSSREQVHAALRLVAASNARTLRRYVVESDLASLAPDQRYDILAQIPREGRTAADWDLLVRAAISAGRLADALQHADAALAAGADDGRQFDRHKNRVEVLLRLGKSGEALRAAETWANSPGVAVGQLATIAELLAQFDAKQSADGFFVRALDVQKLTADQRHDLHWRRAAVNAGLPRWRCLLEAAALVPAGSTQRAKCVQIVLKELAQPIHAATAATLAAETKDEDLKAALVLRQAELSPDPAVAGDLAWQLYQDGRLPAGSLLWACRQWLLKPQRVITALERDLRAGKALADEQAEVLEQAYRAVGRPLDARRAATSDPPPAPPMPAAVRPGPQPAAAGPRGGMGMF